MSAEWSGQSKGTALGYSIFIFLIRFCGLRIAYALLKIVILFYLFFSAQANDALIQFYKKVGLAAAHRWQYRYQNFNFFGQALIDKIATYAGYAKSLSFDFENENELHKLAASGSGALLIGAHLGNWEIASQLMHRISKKVYVLMLENEHEKIKDLINAVTHEKSFEIIPLTEDITMMIKVKTALDEGSFICMHADRYLNKNRTISLDFLGEKTIFPEGPFILASKLNVPVSFVYAIKKSELHYDFSCTDAIQSQHPLEIAQSYVQLLEKMARLYPLQWYNFYQYWTPTDRFA